MEVVRQAAALPRSHRNLVRGAALAVAGDLVAAGPVLDTCSEQSVEYPSGALGARLLRVVLDALVQPGPATSRAFDAVVAEAERRGMTWLARVAHGMSQALLADDAGATAAVVVATCEHLGDAWGAALVAAAAAAHGLRKGCTDPAPMEHLATRFRRLDAGALEAWAWSGYALAVAAEGLPDAPDGAMTAECFARSAVVPGALCAAYAALAVTRPEQREELLDLARVSAAAVGLGPAPHGWRQVVARLSTPVAPGATAAAPTARPGTTATPAGRVERPAVTTIALRCFGELRITRQGQPVDISVIRPRARSVLRMLALHTGGLVHREEMMDALWGDYGRSAAMHNLQVNLSTVRAALAGDPSLLVVRDGDAYALVPPPGSACDLTDFDRSVAAATRARGAGDVGAEAAALRAAVEAYTGDLFPEEGPADWVVLPREQYRLRAAEAASLLAALELDGGNAAAAVATARRSVRIDPCRDGAWRTLIEALHRSGDLAARERAQREYADVLLDLGVEPVAAVPAWADRQRGQVVTASPGTPAPRPLPGRPVALGTPTRP